MRQLGWALLLWPSLAQAGGFFLPGNGTEALGRGGAFTAKADNPTALEYNVAGLAGQRGTQLLFDSNVVIPDTEFERAGSYPAATAASLPYEGRPFGSVHNQGGSSYAPFLGITSDFGYFSRWTFAIGLFGPSAVSSRAYPTAVAGGWPAPSRYDLVAANLLVLYPTVATAVRVTRWLDLGVALHFVVSQFELESTAFVDLGRSECPYPEFAGCDTRIRVKTSGFTATAALGALVHPTRSVDLGLEVRPQIDIDTSGSVSATAPPVLSTLSIAPSTARFQTHLPWTVRLGARYRFLRDRFEVGDIELDTTYEAWHAAEGGGDTLFIRQLSLFNNLTATIAHHYQDTVTVQLGGAYNLALRTGTLSFRAGGYFDSAATQLGDTRLDFDAAEKYAATFGFGYTVRGVTLNAAYAYVYQPDRTVTNGRLRSINGTDGSTTASDGAPLPVINNGQYRSHTQIVSLGLQVAWDLHARARPRAATP